MRWLGAAALLAAVGFGAIFVDAAARRSVHRRTVAVRRAVVRVVGADLALSSSSRWLRHPSTSEPGAPFADAPAILDTDPGGGMIGPPLELLRIGWRPLRVRRGTGRGE